MKERMIANKQQRKEHTHTHRNIEKRNGSKQSQQVTQNVGNGTKDADRNGDERVCCANIFQLYENKCLCGSFRGNIKLFH